MIVFLDLSDNHLGIVKHPPDAASPDALILWVWDGGLRIYTDTWDPCLFPMLHRKARSTREIPTCHEEGAVHGRPVLASPSLGRLTQENQVPGGEGAWLWGKFPESRIPSTDVLWSGHQAWLGTTCLPGRSTSIRSEISWASSRGSTSTPESTWGNETLWSLLSGLGVKTKFGKIILQTK